jgi:biopolymer transport protein ExbD
MNFRRGRARDEPDINLIPLIDILIVILIFLFLTTTYSRYADLQINLPEAGPTAATDKPSMLSVAVDATGKYAINGTPTPFGNTLSFSNALKVAAKGAKEPVVAISADAAATHQSVINVMESARLAGYNHISFTTQTKR